MARYHMLINVKFEYEVVEDNKHSAYIVRYFEHAVDEWVTAVYNQDGKLIFQRISGERPCITNANKSLRLALREHASLERIKKETYIIK